MSEDILDLGYARVDLDRESRQGLAEVIYGPGKTVEQIVGIVRGLLTRNRGPVLVTRVEADAAREISAAVTGATYDEPGRILSWRRGMAGRDAGGRGSVAVATAGTSDGPVAAEALAVCAALGITTTAIRDVGVAGMHRLMANVEQLRAADVVIVVAGMEGALASVVGGLVAAPVVAVPTSVGYGASFDGIAALLAMHAGCAAGVTVVNIDSGFGAALAAHRLLLRMTRFAPPADAP